MREVFQFYEITLDQKINLATTYLNEVADSWYQGWVQDERMQGSWADFVEGLCERFGEKSMANIVEEFIKLKQEGTVVEYQAQFEELRSMVCPMQPGLTEQYLVSSFISGLREELRPMVKMMTPTFVRQAAEKARLQEVTLEAIFKKHEIPYKPSLLVGQYWSGSSRSLLTWPNQEAAKEPSNNNGTKGNLIEKRRQLGLCFRCGDNYSPGHQCKRQLMYMEGYDGEKEEEGENVFYEEIGECKMIIGEESQLHSIRTEVF